VEGVAEEEEVDDQLLWNLQILSEVRIYHFYIFAHPGADILSVRTICQPRNKDESSCNLHVVTRTIEPGSCKEDHSSATTQPF